MKLRRVGRPVTPEDVARVEREFKFVFPEAYKNFLLTEFGGEPDADECYFVLAASGREISLGHIYPVTSYDGNATLSGRNKDLLGRIPDRYVAFACTYGGDQYCLNLRKSSADYGAVYHWTHDIDEELPDGSSTSQLQARKIASNFDEWMQSLVLRNDDDD